MRVCGSKCPQVCVRDSLSLSVPSLSSSSSLLFFPFFPFIPLLHDSPSSPPSTLLSNHPISRSHSFPPSFFLSITPSSLSLCQPTPIPPPSLPLFLPLTSLRNDRHQHTPTRLQHIVPPFFIITCKLLYDQYLTAN